MYQKIVGCKILIKLNFSEAKDVHVYGYHVLFFMNFKNLCQVDCIFVKFLSF